MGPLAGIKVIELAAVGPVPFCAMLLSDMGAEVLRLDRIDPGDSLLPVVDDAGFAVLNRGRRSVAIDLKHERSAETVLRLAERADVLIEGFRPGVAERLGIGPDECCARNPRLIYGRMTGWGQDGPLAHAPGHDINYISLAGPLAALGEPGSPPSPPLNLVGDFGGGALFLAFGVVAALHEAGKSGRGQVLDVSMVEGAAYLSTPFYGMTASGYWRRERGANLLDGGAPFYSVYECKDGRYLSVGAIEGRFYGELLRLTGLDAEDLPAQFDRARWPEARERFARLFRTKTRDEWCGLLAGSGACVAPVLDFVEAPHHPHNAARGSFVEVEGVVQPGPAPRFSRTPPEVRRSPSSGGDHSREALADWGFGAEEIDALVEAGAIAIAAGR